MQLGKKPCVRPALAGLLMLAVSSAAFGLSVSTPPTFVNSVGQPVSAHAEFTFRNGGIMVSLQNETDGPRYFTQTLSGIKFKIKNFNKGEPFLQNSRGNVRLIGTDGTPGNPSAESTNWAFDYKNGQFSLTAPGKLYTLLPETSPKDYYNADTSLLGNGQRPFITGPTSFFIAVPEMGTDSQIEDVQFVFSDQADDIGLVEGSFNRPDAIPETSFDPGDLNLGGTPQISSGNTPGGPGNYSPPYLPPIGYNPSNPTPGYPDTPSYNSDNNYDTPNYDTSVANTPEPATITILAGAGLGLMLKGRKRK